MSLFFILNILLRNITKIIIHLFFHILNSLYEDLNSISILFSFVKASGTVLILRIKNHSRMFGDRVWSWIPGTRGGSQLHLKINVFTCRVTSTTHICVDQNKIFVVKAVLLVWMPSSCWREDAFALKSFYKLCFFKK